MKDFLLVFFVIIIPFLIFVFFSYNKMSLLKTNLISFVFWMYFSFSFIGIISLYFGWDAYRVAIGVSDKDLIIKLMIYSGVAYFTFMFSYFFWIRIMGNKGTIGQSKEFVLIEKMTLKSKKTIIFLFVISTFVFIFYLTQIPQIPILAVFKGYSSIEIKQFRSMSTNDFSGKLHYYKLFFDTAYLLVSLSLFSNYLITRTKSSLRLFSFTSLFTIFAAIYSTQKAVIVWFIFGLILVYFITLNKKIKLKNIGVLITLIFTFMYFLYKYFMNMQEKSFIEISAAIFSRTFSGQIAPAYYYLELFPEKINYLMGRSFPNPGGILPWEHYNLIVEVMNYKFHNLSSLGIIGTAPTAFWGEAFVNFGIAGIIMASFYIGLLLALTQHVFDNKKKNPITIAIYVWFMLEFKNLALTGISNYLFNIDIIFVIFLYLIMHISVTPKAMKNMQTNYSCELHKK